MIAALDIVGLSGAVALRSMHFNPAVMSGICFVIKRGGRESPMVEIS